MIKDDKSDEDDNGNEDKSNEDKSNEDDNGNREDDREDKSNREDDKRWGCKRWG